MNKKVSIVFLGLVMASLLVVPVMAQPPEKTEAFVCPVITQEAVGMHNPIASPIGEGHYTVVPTTANNGNLYVPIHATNGDGAGTPPGPHSQPGDTDYTAIWAAQ